MFSRFFIHHPIFAAVVSIVIVLIGALSIPALFFIRSYLIEPISDTDALALLQGFEVSDGVVIPAGRYRFSDTQLSIETPRVARPSSIVDPATTLHAWLPPADLLRGGPASRPAAEHGPHPILRRSPRHQRRNTVTGYLFTEQRGRQAGDLARMAALEAGYDIRSSGMTLDRFCGSGITSVNLAAMNIMSGAEDLVIGGGAEMMSTYGEEGAAMNPFLDNGNLLLREMHPQPHQGLCADAIATLEGIDREAVDKLAVLSQQRADHAIRNGHFDKALIPVYNEDGSLALDHEEFPRPGTTADSLAALAPSR